MNAIQQAEEDFGKLAGKTILRVQYKNSGDWGHSTLNLELSDGTSALITSFGWADGVGSDGGDLEITFSPNAGGQP